MLIATQFPTTLAFDTTLRRPGCAIMQALFGGNSRAAQEFPSETWLVHPTEHMRTYRVETESQLEVLVAMATKAIR